MNSRTALASFDPTKMGETDLQTVTDAMYALMDQGGQKYPSKLGRRDAIRRHCIDCCGGDLSEVRRTNPIARVLRTPTFRQRKVRPKKVRGSYLRCRV
jgi:hypothetical protein